MQFHARSAGISENCIDPLPFQRLNQDFAAEHGRPYFGTFRRRTRLHFDGFADSTHRLRLCLVGGPQANEKPTTVSSRGFLSKFLLLAATSSHGGAYDAYR